MRAVRPRRLEHVVPFEAAAEPAALIDNFSRLSACSFIVIVCDFSVTWICGALAQFTSVIVPTIEYTVEDAANRGGTGAGGGSVLGFGGTVEVEDGLSSGSVLRSIRRPASEGDFAGAFPSGAAARSSGLRLGHPGNEVAGFICCRPIGSGFLER